MVQMLNARIFITSKHNSNARLVIPETPKLSARAWGARTFIINKHDSVAQIRNNSLLCSTSSLKLLNAINKE